MLVDGDSKLSRALKLHPDVLEVVVALNPHDFVRLRNPFMRKLMAPRITLSRIARMTGTPLRELLARIHEAAGEPFEGAVPDAEPLPENPASPPPWISEPHEVVDLLEADERLDTDPMPPIFRALRRVGRGEPVLVKHKWEPQPLYDVWKTLGVEWYAERHSENEWYIWIAKTRPLPNEP